MRKVKVGAIQPGPMDALEIYNCLSEGYRNIPGEILSGYVEGRIGITLDLLEKAGREGCDIVTTCEDAAGIGNYIVDIRTGNVFPQLVDLSCSLLETELARISKKYSMYIAGCYFKSHGTQIHNTASIFDRNGNICGEYRKTHLPPDEKWQVAEGDRIDVFELDFGKIAICICYDMMFPELIRVEALKGAEIIFHPTVGYGWYDGIGEATLRTRANDNSVYIVTSKNAVFNGAGKSSVIDFWGHVLADAGFYENVLVSREIDLDRKKTQPAWFNPTQMSGTAEVGFRMSRERRPELYGPICSPLPEKFSVPGRIEQLELIDRIKSGRCRWNP